MPKVKTIIGGRPPNLPMRQSAAADLGASAWLKARLAEKPEHKFCAAGAPGVRITDAGAYGRVIAAPIGSLHYFIFASEAARDAFVKAGKGSTCPVPVV